MYFDVFSHIFNDFQCLHNDFLCFSMLVQSFSLPVRWFLIKKRTAGINKPSDLELFSLFFTYIHDWFPLFFNTCPTFPVPFNDFQCFFYVCSMISNAFKYSFNTLFNISQWRSTFFDTSQCFSMLFNAVSLISMISMTFNAFSMLCHCFFNVV